MRHKMKLAKYRGKPVDRHCEWVKGCCVWYMNDGFERAKICRCNHDITQEEFDPIVFVEVIPETTGQFTNVKDDSDEKIYKGDLLSISMGGCKQVNYYEVKDLRSFYESLDTTDYYLRITSKKVIGNIYKSK